MTNVYAGGGSSSSQISMCHSTSMQGVGVSGGLAAVMAGVLKGLGDIQSEKETIQCLNDHLASYLERVTNITQLETEIKALKEELLSIKKNHEEEVHGLQNQIANSGLTVELGASKSQDFSMILVTSGPSMAVEALLNIKVKLEAEIFTYFNLLEDGRASSLVTPWTTEISCNPSRRPPPAVLDSEVVSEVNDTKALKQ
ncbi:Keratin, type I cytoskeletal 18 [Myotis davidii]|uniref:Keratin, type I cytoskeletal 18 n=1 Tax=Myotis davidii TaxID=225400 RepID=L5MA16_MYODS|nr:Keratin, type I cytoskeletal 18 [Myotis davidii]